MAFVLRDEVEIAETPERVWEVISDFARYRDWNPFVIDARSSLEVGAGIWMRVRVFPWFSQPQSETILECEDGRGFAYGIRLPFGALSSRRRHEIAPAGRAGTRYVSHFELEGWLTPLVQMLTGRRLREGFSQMTRAVRDRAESLAGAA